MKGIASLCCALLYSGGALGQEIPRPDKPPTQSLNESCVTKSLALRNMTTYQIQLSYSNSSTEENSVVFQLYNPAIQVDAQCTAYGPSVGVGNDSRQTWHPCFVESIDERIHAAFKYDFLLNQVTVNETWVCDTASTTRQYVLIRGGQRRKATPPLNPRRAGTVFSLLHTC